MITCNRRIHKMIEFCKMPEIIPNLSIRCPKNMSSIFVHDDARLLICITIPSDMVASFNNQAGAPMTQRRFCKDSIIKPSTYQKIIVHKTASFIFEKY